MSLGQLGIHIATVPGALANLVQDDGFDVSQAKFEPPQPKSLQEILDAFDASVGEAETRLKEMTDEKAHGRWTLKLHDKELFSKPWIGILRSIMSLVSPSRATFGLPQAARHSKGSRRPSVHKRRSEVHE